MRTLDNHLVGVTADRPHPESYRPDLPLVVTDEPEENDDEGESVEDIKAAAKEEGYDDGFADGYSEGKGEGYAEGERDTEARIRRQAETPGA